MVKIGSLRKRYIKFELAHEMDKKDFEPLIYRLVLQFFGELGFSKVAFKLAEFDGLRGIIRCERTYLEEMKGFLALQNEPRIKVIATSGTIEALKRKTK